MIGTTLENGNENRPDKRTDTSQKKDLKIVNYKNLLSFVTYPMKNKMTRSGSLATICKKIIKAGENAMAKQERANRTVIAIVTSLMNNELGVQMRTEKLATY